MSVPGGAGGATGIMLGAIGLLLVLIVAGPTPTCAPQEVPRIAAGDSRALARHFLVHPPPLHKSTRPSSAVVAALSGELLPQEREPVVLRDAVTHETTEAWSIKALARRCVFPGPIPAQGFAEGLPCGSGSARPRWS